MCKVKTCDRFLHELHVVYSEELVAGKMIMDLARDHESHALLRERPCAAFPVQI